MLTASAHIHTDVQTKQFINTCRFIVRRIFGSCAVHFLLVFCQILATECAQNSIVNTHAPPERFANARWRPGAQSLILPLLRNFGSHLHPRVNAIPEFLECLVSLGIPHWQFHPNIEPTTKNVIPFLAT